MCACVCLCVCVFLCVCVKVCVCVSLSLFPLSQALFLSSSFHPITSTPPTLYFPPPSLSQVNKKSIAIRLSDDPDSSFIPPPEAEGWVQGPDGSYVCILRGTFEVHHQYAIMCALPPYHTPFLTVSWGESSREMRGVCVCVCV